MTRIGSGTSKFFDSRKPSKFKFEDSLKHALPSKIDKNAQNAKTAHKPNYMCESSDVIKEETPTESAKPQFHFKDSVSGKMKNVKPFKIGLIKNNTSLNNSRRR